MKIQVNNKEVFDLNSTKQKVIQNDIPSEIFEQDMERRVRWVIEHKYERCMHRLKQEWEPKLAATHNSIPTDPDAFAKLVFSQPDYQSRSQREAKAKAQEKNERVGK